MIILKHVGDDGKHYFGSLDYFTLGKPQIFQLSSYHKQSIDFLAASCLLYWTIVKKWLNAVILKPYPV